MSFEQNLSKGTLKADGSGACLPSSTAGIFKEDSLLNPSNYIEVEVNVTETGNYTIKSDSVNGYSFAATGAFNATGLTTVRLFGNGRPADAGINTFTISFDSTTCLIDVPVISVGAPGVYTLGGAGGTCTGISTNGVFVAGIPMLPGNSVTLNVNVTTLGSYTLTTPVVNGFSFSGAGDFISLGAQTVTLTASGIATAAGTSTFTLTGNGTSCSFPVTVAATPSVGAFTLGGAGSTCTGAVTAGTYAAGTSLGSGNTVTINVTVTALGAYLVSTAPANGVVFSKAGMFTALGPQTITLSGSGTPTSAGPVTHTVSAGSATCTFSITYTTGGGGGGTYSFAGSPNACTGAIVSGTYNAGTALNTTNTVSLQINVITVGAYSISTNISNGMTFSTSGVFTSTGVQQVVLIGTGTPLVAGVNVFTPGCTFTITVTGTGPLPTDFIIAKFDGIIKTFNANASATYFAPAIDLDFMGEVTNGSTEALYFNINTSGAAIAPGNYVNTVAASTSYAINFFYTDPTGVDWFPKPTVSGAPDPFTITISTLTATRVTGTFSGTIRVDGTGTSTKAVTEGSFSLPIL